MRRNPEAQIGSALMALEARLRPLLAKAHLLLPSSSPKEGWNSHFGVSLVLHRCFSTSLQRTSRLESLKTLEAQVLILLDAESPCLKKKKKDQGRGNQLSFLE